MGSRLGPGTSAVDAPIGPAGKPLVGVVHWMTHETFIVPESSALAQHHPPPKTKCDKKKEVQVRIQKGSYSTEPTRPRVVWSVCRNQINAQRALLSSRPPLSARLLTRKRVDRPAPRDLEQVCGKRNPRICDTTERASQRRFFFI